MSIGPIISALSGVPAGRIVDRLGAPIMVIVGLVAMAAGSLALSVLPAMFGVAGYIAAIAVLTPGYQLFQAANNTAVMTDVRADQRGVISGMLNLSRNLGLVTGASVDGRRVRARLGNDRHHDGASRGGCRRHAGHLRRRDDADRRRARDRNRSGNERPQRPIATYSVPTARRATQRIAAPRTNAGMSVYRRTAQLQSRPLGARSLLGTMRGLTRNSASIPLSGRRIGAGRERE